MKLMQIFEFVGLSVEQVREAARKASHPAVPGEPTITRTPESARPKCKVCGRPVGKYSCWPGPSIRMNRVIRDRPLTAKESVGMELIRERIRGEFPPL